MSSALLIFLLSLLVPWTSLAVFEFRTENYLYTRHFSMKTADLDPSNRIFSRPSNLIQNDLRPELKLTHGDQKWIVRPRWLYTYENIEFNDTSQSWTRSFGKIDLTDAYWESIINDELRATIGLQVYQWGPAEFLNASNPLFHLNAQQRSTLFKEKGKVLLRLNVDYSRNLNQVLIHEPIANRDAEWIADNHFNSKSLIKTEWVDDSNVNSVGFVFGKEERNLGFFGEYLSYSPVEGFNFYLDSKHSKNSLAYYPNAGSLVYDPILHSGWTTFGVVGIRKEWSHLDLRYEYIYNSAGWTTDQFKEVKTTLTINPQNLKRFVRPGLELLGRHYSYLSLRFFSLGKKKNHGLAFRYLHSNTDSSGNLISTYDWDFDNSISIFGEFNSTFGEKESELNLLQQQSFMIGFRWSL